MSSLDRATVAKDSDRTTEWAVSGPSRQFSRLAVSRTSEDSSLYSLKPSSPTSSSSSSRALESSVIVPADRDEKTSSTQKPLSHRTIRKRPSLSDLQKHMSTSKIVDEQHPARCSQLPSTCPKRRSFSANAALQARTRFTSPDRYIPQRPPGGQASPNVHTSKPPSALYNQEIYTRSRDASVDPFGSASPSRSATVVRRRIAGDTLGIRVPHYTPSFVNGTDAGLVEASPRASPQNTRQPSWGGFWTVGGRGGAQFGQLHGVPTASGGLLTSGTSAPLHCAPFLDEPTQDDKTKAHESRLALALDIDQAARILSPTPSSSPSAGLQDSGEGPSQWNDETWTRRHPPKGDYMYSS